jgi:hypothetical protein
MTKPQEAHLAAIKARFSSEVDGKYRRGQREHGGDLFRLNISSLLREIKQEILDLYVYADSLEALILPPPQEKKAKRGVRHGNSGRV